MKVALTGDGADEIFYGYNRYIFAEKIWKKINFLPKSIRKSISQLIYNISPKNWISLQKFLSNSLFTNSVGTKVIKPEAKKVLSDKSK